MKPCDYRGLFLVKSSVELGGCEIHLLACIDVEPCNVLGSCD